MSDINLSDLDQYYGTEHYHRITPFKTVVTDGVGYIIENGYSWFVTDSLAVIEHKLSKQDFVAVKLRVTDGQATMTIEDGDGKVLHKQDYEYTDAKRDLTLYVTADVMMLSSEY